MACLAPNSSAYSNSPIEHIRADYKIYALHLLCFENSDVRNTFDNRSRARELL